MPHYQRVGDVPRKRHTLHRYDGDVAFEELMGAEGFSGPSALAVSPALAVGDRARRAGPRSVADLLAPEPAAATAPPAHRRSATHPERAVRATPFTAGRRCSATTTSSRLRDGRGSNEPAVSRRDRRRARVSCTTATRCSRACSAASLVTAGDYVVIPTSTTHRWVVDDTCRAVHHLGAWPRARAGSLPQRARPDARRRAVQRARPARAGTRAAARGRRGGARCSCGLAPA